MKQKRIPHTLHSFEAGDRFEFERSPAQIAIGKFSHDPIHALFFAEIIAVAQIVVMGYDLVGHPDDPIPQAINRALGAIDVVGERVTNVLNQITQLLSALDKLEARIKGKLDLDRVKAAMVSIGTRSNIIRPLVRNEEKLRSELARVIAHMDQLQDDIRQAQAFSDGLVAGAFNTAAGIALWTQTFTLVQRARNDLSYTVWDDPFHQQNMEMFRRIFSIDSVMSPEYRKELDSYVFPATATSRFRDNRFVDSGIAWSTEYWREPQYADLFFVHFEPDYLHTTVPAKHVYPCEPPECPPPDDVYRWAFTNDESKPFPNPDLVRRAKTAFRDLAMRRDVLLNHLSLFKDAPAAAAAIEGVAAKPSEWHRRT